MVRLRAANSFMLTGGSPSFQFQYGAIESGGYPSGGKYYVEFQFQYGAIERGIKQAATSFQYGFQFQYGAIESLMMLD